MLLTIILICVCVYLVYKFVCWRYVPSVNSLVPTQPGRLPLLGNALIFVNLEEIQEQLMILGKFSQDLGGVSLIYFGPFPFYVITDPEDVSTVLNKCLDKMFIYKLIEPLLGKMLVAAEVPFWKRSRRIIDLSFKQHLLDDYLDVFNGEGLRLVQALAEDVGKGEVDVTGKVTRSFLETSCRTTMGLRVDGKDLVNDKFVHAVDSFMQIITFRLFRPWFLLDPIFKLSSYKKKLDEASEIFFSVTKQMVALRKEEYLKRLKNKQDVDSQDRFRSFLDVLIENSVTETGSTFTDSEMRNLVDNVLLAAFDTTICEMIIVLACIGSHPEVQDKIYEEITDVLGKDGKVTRVNISKLVYLDAAIKESIRLYPIGPVIGRQATTDVKLRNTTLPAGSNIVVHLWEASRHRKYWGADAEEYKPERWLSDALPKLPAAFASFSPGKRGCPGKNYTLMYFKAVLVPLIRTFRLTADHTKMKLKYNVMIKATSGHHIKFEYR